MLANVGAGAQPGPFECAALRASSSRQPAYGLVAGPVAGQQRCEGFFERNVSQPFLELLSLTRSPPGSWALDGEGRLNLRGLPQFDARLLIQPLRSNPLYRVDAWLPRGTSFDWPSTPMLRATRLQLRDLGLLAFVGPSVPTPRLAPVSTGAGDGGPLVHAVLRPSVAVASLAWRAYRPGAVALDAPPAVPTAAPPSPPAAGASATALPSPSAWQVLPGATLFAWERYALAIPMPTDGLALHVDVRAVDQQGQDLPLLRFVVLGPRDDKF